MAQVTGYVCDVCEAYSQDRSTWLKVTANATATGDKGWDVCSNKCLIRLGRERAGESGEETRRRRLSDDQKLEVVEYAKANGNASAAERFSLHVATVAKWVREMA